MEYCATCAGEFSGNSMCQTEANTDAPMTTTCNPIETGKLTNRLIPTRLFLDSTTVVSNMIQFPISLPASAPG